MIGVELSTLFRILRSGVEEKFTGQDTVESPLGDIPVMLSKLGILGPTREPRIKNKSRSEVGGNALDQGRDRTERDRVQRTELAIDFCFGVGNALGYLGVRLRILTLVR